MADKIVQVIGCAYTFRVSQVVRDAFAKDRTDHSSHAGAKAFSYFKKIESPEHIVKNNESLVLRKHPETQQPVDHWYEPELGLLLGKRHAIVAYTLGNDLTAAKIEFEQARSDYDPTHYGKCWKGSCSIGPRFFGSGEIENIDDLIIGLRILRNRRIIYDYGYSTSQRLRELGELPDMILEKLRSFGNILQLSKQILVARSGFLPEGTVILAGTGLIMPKRCYAADGDIATVYSPAMGELSNPVKEGC